MCANIPPLNTCSVVDILCGVCGIRRVWRLRGEGWGGVGWVTVKKLFIKRAITHWWNQTLCRKLGWVFCSQGTVQRGEETSDLNEAPPPLVFLLFSLLLLSLPSSFSGPEEVVFVIFNHFLDREDWDSAESMWVAPRPEHTSFCVQGLNPLTLLKPFATFLLAAYTIDYSLEMHPQKVKKKKKRSNQRDMLLWLETMLAGLYSPGHLSDNLDRKQRFHFCASPSRFKDAFERAKGMMI